MGGFAIECQTHPGSESNGIEVKLLPLDGVRVLAKLSDDLPCLGIQAIQDRSKADTLSKSLACIQALYIVLQTFGRLRSDLPVTALEINTIGHVICALAMFVFWWYKPLNVESPEIARGPMEELHSTLWSLSDINNGTFWYARANISNSKDDLYYCSFPEFIDCVRHLGKLRKGFIETHNG